MSRYLLGLLIFVLANCNVANLFAAVSQPAFHATVLWENDLDRGVLLVSPTEMWVIDTKGQKYAKVNSQEAVKRVYISPDTKKLTYTTASGVWFVKLDTGENRRIALGDCNFLRWDSTSLGLIFSIDNYGNDSLAQGTDTKLFLADGDGKNLKQVYP